MTTLIYIENVLGSGQMVKLREDFGDYSVSRDLKPGEHARLVVSPFKSLSVEEVVMSTLVQGISGVDGALIEFPSPRRLTRRRG